MTEQFVIGIIGPPFGLDGFVKVRSLSGEIDHLLVLTDVIIRQDGRERRLKIEESKALLPGVLMRFAGVDNPQAAKALTGAELLAGRDQASPLQDGEFYIEDLKGLAVFAEKDESLPATELLGHITGIIEGGGGELAEIKLGSGELRLVPFRQEFFAEIDLPGGKAILKNLWILE